MKNEKNLYEEDEIKNYNPCRKELIDNEVDDNNNDDDEEEDDEYDDNITIENNSEEEETIVISNNSKKIPPITLSDTAMNIKSNNNLDNKLIGIKTKYSSNKRNFDINSNNSINEEDAEYETTKEFDMNKLKRNLNDEENNEENEDENNVIDNSSDDKNTLNNNCKNINYKSKYDRDKEKENNNLKEITKKLQQLDSVTNKDDILNVLLNIPTNKKGNKNNTQKNESEMDKEENEQLKKLLEKTNTNAENINFDNLNNISKSNQKENDNIVATNLKKNIQIHGQVDYLQDKDLLKGVSSNLSNVIINNIPNSKNNTTTFKEKSINPSKNISQNKEKINNQNNSNINQSINQTSSNIKPNSSRNSPQKNKCSKNSSSQYYKNPTMENKFTNSTDRLVTFNKLNTEYNNTSTQKKSINAYRNMRIYTKTEADDINDNDSNTKISKISNNEDENVKVNDQKLFEVLMNEREHTEADVKNKYQNNKKSNISNRVKDYLDKKEKNLSLLKQKVDDEFNKRYTFSPSTNKNVNANSSNTNNLNDELIKDHYDNNYNNTNNTNNNNTQKRNLNEFLKDQENYEKNKQKKLSLMKDYKEKKDNEELKVVPQINNVSKKMANEKYKGEDVSKRLYSQPKNKLLLNNINSSSNTNSNKNNLSKRQQANNSNNKPLNSEYLKSLYDDAKKREIKIKEKEELETKKLKKNNYKTNKISNKYLLKRYKEQFKEEIEKIILSSSINLNENQNGNHFNQGQLKTLLVNLGFISDSFNQNNELQNKLLNDIYSCLSHTVKNDDDKSDDDTMDEPGEKYKIDHIFIFTLSILNLLEYYIVSGYRNVDDIQKDDTNFQPNSNRSVKSLNKKNVSLNSNSNSGNSYCTNNSKGNEEEIEYNNLVNKINNDLTNRIVTPRKYGGFDSNNNYIITLSQSKIISKDFSYLYQNYSLRKVNNSTNSNSNTSTGYTKNITESSVNNNNHFNNLLHSSNKKLVQTNPDYSLRSSSKRLLTSSNLTSSNKLLDKPNKCNNNVSNINNSNSQSTNDLSTYKKKSKSISKSEQHNNLLISYRGGNSRRLEELYLDSAKKRINIEKVTEKYKKEKELEEQKNCTFKPKISQIPNYSNNIIPADNFTQSQRMELLYKKGTECSMNKRDKTANELDVEKYASECTFKPSINKVNEELFNKNKKNLYIDNDSIKFNERLRQGRYEKEYKESIFERGEFLFKPNYEGEYISNNSSSKNIKNAYKSLNTDFNVGMSDRNKYKNSFIQSSNVIKSNKIKSMKESLLDNNINNTYIKNNNKNCSSNKIKGKKFCQSSNKLQTNNIINTKNDSKYKNNENIGVKEVKNDNVNENGIGNKQEKCVIDINDVDDNSDENINGNNTSNINKKMLLEIEVNLKHGIKKKISVFEGNTAEELAEKFSLENNLENKIKNKLVTLIKNEINKLNNKKNDK